MLAYPGRWSTADVVNPTETPPSTVAVTLFGARARKAQHASSAAHGSTEGSVTHAHVVRGAAPCPGGLRAPRSHPTPPHVPCRPLTCAWLPAGRARLGAAAVTAVAGAEGDASPIQPSTIEEAKAWTLAASATTNAVDGAGIIQPSTVKDAEEWTGAASP